MLAVSTLCGHRWRRIHGRVVAILSLAACLLGTAALGCRASAPPSTSAPSVRNAQTSSDGAVALVLISFDGWRWDYHAKTATPNLHRLIARGVRSEGLIPAYPAKTFPNHYTIVTGLYPERHGIVGNTMREPGTNLRFGLSNRSAVADPRWWGGEPIWATAKRQGLRTATLFWPGSEAAIGGVRPDYWEPYDAMIPNDVRVDRILAWLDLPPAKRPAFITGYFSDADTVGHGEGPESADVLDVIGQLDRVIGRLLAGLDSRRLTERVNVVLVSDHGMADRSPDRVIALADYVDLETIDIVEIDPGIALNPRTTSVDDVYRRLARAHPHLHVYRKEQSPAHWRARSHPRIPAIIGVVDEGWRLQRTRSAKTARGQHGYDPRVRSMHGLFVAAGPSFRKGVIVPAFENVHVYNALSEAMGLTPAPNDGDPAIAQRLTTAEVDTAAKP